jgi:hypothetical protein
MAEAVGEEPSQGRSRMDEGHRRATEKDAGTE